MDDLGLLREYAACNSEAAFTEVISRRVNFVYSSALRQVRNPNLAQEVTQAVFIILARKAGCLPDGTLLSGWLFRTTRFVALAQLRADAKRRQRDLDAHMQSELQSDTPNLLWEQMSPLLDEALAQLGEKDRQAVLLRYFENKSLAEVGRFQRTGENTAGKRVARALEKLRRLFLARGISSTTVIIAGVISINSVQAAPIGLSKVVVAVAVTKGAAVSGSTLTLIKGALKLMAWTKIKIAAVGVGLVLIVGTSTVLVRERFLNPREPSFQGRRLSAWLAEYRSPPDQQANAGEAIRKMGIKTLPFLVADIAREQDAGVRKVHYFEPDKRTPDQRCSQATWAFDALGPLGKTAIPELTNLLEQNPGYVPLALGGIGREALPELLNALTNGTFWVRDNTAAAIANAIYSGKIKSEEARPSWPIAISNLTYTSTNSVYLGNTRSRAAGLLGALKLEPEISVQALRRGLQNTNLTVAMVCAQALGGFGRDARVAVPDLMKAASSTDTQLSAAATRALESIEHMP